MSIQEQSKWELRNLRKQKQHADSSNSSQASHQEQSPWQSSSTETRSLMTE